MVPVKLPKEVRSLFPTWEYRCPSCSTYVESNISFCPNCKTVFDEKRWRVPPRFLKSHEVMSEYAHKVLAPKLTPKQRELLFQYFTELFSDGFESGDTSAWNGTNGSPIVTSSFSYRGNYSCNHTVTGSGANSVWAYIGEETVADVYVRIYFRYNTLPTSNGNIASLMALHASDWFALLDVTLSYSDTESKYRFNGYNYELSESHFSDYLSLSEGTWYCLETRRKVSSVTGVIQVWLDGNLIIDWSGDTGVDENRVFLAGFYWAYVAQTMFMDCVVVADTYIGPEGGAQTYTKTWTADALFKKLGIPKTLGVETAFQKQNIPKTFALDSTFQKSFTIQKQIDVLFKKLDILKTFGIDIDFLKRNVIKSFVVDVRFGALMTQTISKQIDVLLKKLDLTKNFGLDTYFGSAEAETYSKTFSVSVIFAYKVRLPELWLDENGKLVLNISKPYTWVGS
jgi:hypothetical protein